MSACTIVQLTDLHVRPRGQASNRVSETNALLVRALRAAERLRPAADAVIVTGDLTECGLPAEYAVLREALAAELTRPVYVIPGNHDRREVLLASLPFVPDTHGFVQYAVETLPVRLVMLDTVVPGAGHGALCDTRLEWLERTLAAAPERPTLIGMHHPPFACGIAHMDAIALRAPERFASVLARHRQVQRVVCGHHHRAIVGRVGDAIVTVGPSTAHAVELELRDGAAGAFVMEPPAFHVHRWSAEGGFATHLAFVESFAGPFPFVAEAEYPGGGGAEG